MNEQIYLVNQGLLIARIADYCYLDHHMEQS